MNILLEKIAFYWQEKRQTFVLAVVGALLALISLLINLSYFLPGSDGTTIEDELANVTVCQEELRDLIARKRQLQTPVALLRDLERAFWLPERDGNPAIEFRRRIETAAQQSGIVLKSIGSLQTAKIANGAMSYEVAIQANAKYEELLHFMNALRQDGRGNCFWSTLTLNVDNTNAPNFLLVTGNVKTVAVTAPEILELWRREP